MESNWLEEREKRSKSVHFCLANFAASPNRGTMTGKTKEMSKIKQLLIMHRDGRSNRSIAKDLGMDKETVNNYVNKARALPEGLDNYQGP